MLSRALYRSYVVFYAVRLWRRQHITPAGLTVFAGCLVSCLFGFNVLRSNGFQLTVLFIIILLSSFLCGLIPFRIKVDVKRTLPSYGGAGSRLTYPIEITNRSSRVQKGLTLLEDIQDPRPDFETLLAEREPLEKKRNAWDRRTLYYRWQWLVRRNIKFRPAPIVLPDLLPGQRITVNVAGRAEKRGYHYFPGVIFARSDLFGLWNRLHRVRKQDRLLILPRIEPVASFDLLSNRHYHQGGIQNASSVGDSDEFMSLRPYRPGDPMRNIHWRSFAKTSELVMKEFEDEHFVRHALILDTFSQPENEAVFEKAVSLAASHAVHLQGVESILDLLFVGDRIYSFSSGRGLGQVSKMLEVLACVEPSVQKEIKDLMPVLERNLDKVSGGICIFQGWSDGHARIYRLAEAIGIDLQFLIVTDQPEKMENRIQQATGTLDHIEVINI